MGKDATRSQPHLINCSVPWLSRGKVLSKVYKLRNKLALILHNKKPEWAFLLGDEHWLAMLAYLIDIFSIFNYLKTSIKERNASLFESEGKFDPIKRKLKA